VDDSALFARLHASLRVFYKIVAAGASDSRLLELDGITAAVVPATPDRSFCNGVVYDRFESLERSLDELAGTYDRARVRAWTVWVPEADTKSAELLAESGHLLDADPAGMAMELAGFERPAPEAWIEADADPADVARINDVAYGYEGAFARALARLPDGAHSYVAEAQGGPAACTVAVDHEGDCLITFVATLPNARGSGLATALMTRALIDARERGCTTTSLQATKMGQPIYERLGYRNLGALQMWERRRPAPAGSGSGSTPGAAGERA
jgi:GNAT superfamily N-acetyltransferase